MNIHPREDAVPSNRRVRHERERYSGAFGIEKRMLDAGTLGGVAIMLLAVLWFVVGWFCGRVFFYPPIMFAVGFLAFLGGLASHGAVARSRRRTELRKRRRREERHSRRSAGSYRSRRRR